MLSKQKLGFVIVILALVMLYATQNYSFGISHAHSTELQQEAPYSLDKIVQQVIEYAKTEQLDDPYIEVEPNLWIKQSNYFGIDINGEVYFYSLFPHMSLDPVNRGDLSVDQIIIVYVDEDNDFPIVIYKEKK